MFSVWIFLLPLLLEARAFMILNARSSRCLQAAPAGGVLLRRCDLDAAAQQWRWLQDGLLVSVPSSRCLRARQGEPVQTGACGAEAARWDCDAGRLRSRNSSMMLAAGGRRPVLSRDAETSTWTSLDRGDVCQEKLRSRRASDGPEQLEAAEQPAAMTDQQREYLRWFYRSEDPTMWTFVLLGLSFLCLLVGFLLLGLGFMANKNRRKIAKYKMAAAAAAQRPEELQSVSPLSAGCKASSPPGGRTAASNGELSELKAGSIVLTWKDGDTSCLYAPDPEEENREENQEEENREEENREEENREEENQEEENREENQEEENREEENREEENREALSAAEPTE